ncbi:(Fe-S)-binding protein [Nocardia sp. MW-W600-9]
MSPVSMTLGIISILIGVPAWIMFGLAVRRMVRTIMLGQAAPDRFLPFVPRFTTMVKEFAAHTRMVKFRTVGWAHWLVMVGFMLGFVTVFQAQGQIFSPTFTWPLVGNTFVYHLADELLALGTIIGALVLITIRQLNHPRIPERLSRFSGSNFGAAYFVETIVLVEGISMLGAKALVLAYTSESHASSDFVSMHLAAVLPANATLVSVFAFFKLMAALVWVVVVSRNVNWGVAWHRFSAFFNIYFKREADGSVALGAAKPMISNGKVLDMENVDPDVDNLGVGRMEDFSWKGWLDFTTCTECGRCQSQCPAWNTGKPLSPKLLIMSLRDHGYAAAPYLLAGGRKDPGGDEIGLVDADGKPNEAALAKIPEAARLEAERPLIGGEDVNGVIDPEVLWSCTSCGACVEQCPVDIEHVDHIIDMRRYQVLIESEFPSELAGLFKNLENKGNPWGQNSKDRLNWIKEVDFDIPVFGKDADSFDGYEYLFWVGCAGAYEDRAKKTTKAVAELLATAGTKFMVLGAEETCTGDSARRAGNEFLFQQLAMQNIEVINSVFEGVEQSKKKIVVTCAHCFNALNNEYPQVGGTYEVVHHTQLLNRLVRQKQLVPVASVSQNITYHDPCYLGRHNKIYNAPRELMEASGSTLVEMPRHGERSMCCGAGGARMWMEEQLGKRINVDRVDEALSTNPTKIATGCPFCRVMLTDGVTARQEQGQGEGVEVVDVAQLMLDSITRVDAAELSANLLVVQEPKAEPEPEPEPEPAPVAEVAEEAAPKAAPAGGGLGMKGAAKAPGGGLGMKGAAKAPGGGLGMKGAAKAPGAQAPAAEAAPAEAAPAKGLGMKGGAKAPGGGLGMKGGAKAPGAKAAEAAPAAETAAPAAPVKGLGMKGGAKAPGGGLGMKGGAKAPGAKAPAAPAEAAAPAETTPAPAAPPVKGLGLKGAAKAPGAKAPGAKAPAAPAPAPAPVPAAEVAPAAEAPAAAPVSAPTETKPTVAAKGLAMKSGFKRPGPKAPGAAAPAPAAPAEPEAPAATEPEASAAEPAEPTNGNGTPPVAPPTAKPGGLGFKSGAKAPGRKN